VCGKEGRAQAPHAGQPVTRRYGPKGVGAICDPTAFSGVVELAPGILGPRHGMVAVDLVEPGHEPTEYPFFKIVTRQFFREALPWIVITVGFFEFESETTTPA